MSAYPSVATHSAIARASRTLATLDESDQVASDPPSQLPQPHLDTIEEAGKEQGFAGEHSEPNDDDYVAGTRSGHEREARSY
jgi:hypothetical protein